MRLYTPESGLGFAASRGLAPGSYVVLAPTSRWIAKQWPDDRFATLAQNLMALGKTVVFVGGKSERPQLTHCLALAAAPTSGVDNSTVTSPRVVDLVGETTIAQLMDTISHAALVVANDSAALHIAVGFARPLVALFGPSRADMAGPYACPNDVIQHTQPGDTFRYKDDALRHMIERITIEEVTFACERKLR
jgi:heptosyltransferase-1/heptosyltransferase-2